MSRGKHLLINDHNIIYTGYAGGSTVCKARKQNTVKAVTSSISPDRYHFARYSLQYNAITAIPDDVRYLVFPSTDLCVSAPGTFMSDVIGLLTCSEHLREQQAVHQRTISKVNRSGVYGSVAARISQR